MYDALKNKNLFNFDETIASDIFTDREFPWEVLPHIGAFILTLGATLSPEEYEQKEENIWIAKSATVAPTASINGPCIIGKNAEIRQCAFIRGNAIVGENCVVGNSTELKNVMYRCRIITMLATPFSATNHTWELARSLPMSSPTRQR